MRDTLQSCLDDLDLKSPEDYTKWALIFEPDVKDHFPLTMPSLMELESVLKKYQNRRDTAAERYRELMTRIEKPVHECALQPIFRKVLGDKPPKSSQL